MIERLSKPQQRQLAVLLLVALVSAVLLSTVLPVWSANAGYRARIDAIETELMALRAETASGERLEPRLEQLRRSQLTAGYYLKSNTEAVAAADLQGLMKRITESNATEILSTQILPAAEEQGFPRVALRVQMRGTLAGLMQTFYAIESSPTFLFMDNVSIRTSTRRRGSRQIAADRFDADLDLIAYMAAEVGS